MNGREKIEAAFSSEGTPEIPAVICYEGIYVRDHWEQLTDYPWWYREMPDLECQISWRRDVIAKTDQDWFDLRCPTFSREERESIYVDVGREGVFLRDGSTGSEEKLVKPQIGGWTSSGGVESVHPDHLAQTLDEIDSRIPVALDYDPDEVVRNGRNDLASRLLQEFGGQRYPVWHVSAPLWRTYRLWGFEGMMVMVATNHRAVSHACRRFVTKCVGEVREAALYGASAIWVEDCLTDMISPRSFESLNVPYVQEIVEEIRSAGMKSIYYYCGNPTDRWDQILSIGADALAFEESKKGFSIDVDEVVERVKGRCTVFGNLDAIDLLQNGTEEQLRTEISRQIAAGRRNNSRFVMSIGSPVTPGTSVDRVRLYCDLVHELGVP